MQYPRVVTRLVLGHAGLLFQDDDSFAWVAFGEAVSRGQANDPTADYTDVRTSRVILVEFYFSVGAIKVNVTAIGIEYLPSSV